MQNSVKLALCLIILISGSLSSAKTSNTFLAIKKAENLTLLQDRLQACSDLYQAFRKAKGEDAALLKEKLFYFSKNFYSDKGFQSYLAGKDFFEKEKYQEAADKLTEADEFEKGNTEVLHHLGLALLWKKKYKEASEVNIRSLQINPIDDELLRDKLAIEISSEAWEEALKTSAELIGPNAGGNFLDLYFKGVALLKLAKKEEAQKVLELALLKEKNYPEIYYFLNELNPQSMDFKLTQKYNDLCKNKKMNPRDPSLCSRMKEKVL